MTLAQLLAEIESQPRSQAIYAAPPWRPSSEAMVLDEPADGSVPDRAVGLTFLTTVREARRAIEERRAFRPDLAETAEEICEAVIYYARYDETEPLPSLSSGAYAAFGV